MLGLIDEADLQAREINKESYDKLGDEISICYGEILTKEIDSLGSEFNSVTRTIIVTGSCLA
jgi:hypothetical protein